MSQNRFDEYYDIRRARMDEIPEIMDFINTFWRKGHILGVNRSFFDYEMVTNGEVNVVVSKTRDSDQIDGMIGYLPCSNDSTKLDTWGVIWKTKPDAKPMLGIEMKKRFCEITGARSHLGTGANPETAVPLLRRILHYYSAKMKHYYRLGDLKEYEICTVKHKDIPPYKDKGELKIKLLPTAEKLEHFFDFSSVEDCWPYKDFWYYNRRFYEHPIYQYEVWGLSGENTKAFFVTRVLHYLNHAALSIVDYAGDASLFSQCGQFFDQIVTENAYEYVDFYFDGFDEEAVQEAGFLKLEEDDTNILPAYFSPFVKSNIDIYVTSQDCDHQYRFFKADGDQDRPN